MATSHVLARVLSATGGAQVNEHVQQLLTHDSIAKMRETEAAARLELQKKKGELRTLVG